MITNKQSERPLVGYRMPVDVKGVVHEDVVLPVLVEHEYYVILESGSRQDVEGVYRDVLVEVLVHQESACRDNRQLS